MCLVNGKAKISTPPQLPHFPTDLSETQNQETYPGYDPARKIWLTWATGRGSAKGAIFGVLLALSLFIINDDGVSKGRWHASSVVASVACITLRQ